MLVNAQCSTDSNTHMQPFFPPTPLLSKMSPWSVSDFVVNYPMMRRLRPLSTLTVLSGPMEMLRLELLSSSDAFRLRSAPPWDLLRSGLITSQVAPPSGSSCCMSCSCAPFRPRCLGAFGDGGGRKRLVNFVTLMGRVVRESGRGMDSTSVSFSRGRLERSEAGRSAGEHATMTWRRWTLDV